MALKNSQLLYDIATWISDK